VPKNVLVQGQSSRDHRKDFLNSVTEKSPKQLLKATAPIRSGFQVIGSQKETLFQAYALKLSERLGGNSQVFLYWKGRVALYALLRAMGVGPGDEVVLPAYTCVVVANAILYTGAVPVYVDARPDTYCLDLDKLEKALTDQTKVVLCQNTYGLSADVEKVVEMARSRGIYTIEDCAHGFGGTYQGKANGTYCDAAFFSTQWNKPFSTGLGGFALVNNRALLPEVEALEKGKQRPTTGEASLLRMLIRLQRWLVRDWSYWKLVALYRRLSRYNLILGSSQGGELDVGAMPGNFFKGLSAVQAREGLRALDHLDEELGRRRRNAEIYTDFLKGKGKNHVARNLFQNHSFLKYPLKVSDRPTFQAAAEKARVPLGDWFCSPLHPVTNRLERWRFKTGDFPVAERLARTVVNLPTDTQYPEKVLSFLTNHLDLVESI
jgi:dTDP-4-amino-4,6-dideoxygalactose transaminase